MQKNVNLVDRSRKMLKEAPTLAIRNVHTAENEPCEVRPLSVSSKKKCRKWCRKYLKKFEGLEKKAGARGGEVVRAHHAVCEPEAAHLSGVQ